MCIEQSDIQKHYMPDNLIDRKAVTVKSLGKK